MYEYHINIKMIKHTFLVLVKIWRYHDANVFMPLKVVNYAILEAKA